MHKKDTSIVIMTADSFRHRFFVDSLAQHFEVCGVVCEKKRPLPHGETDKEDEILQQHFRQRDEKEVEFFGAYSTLRVPEERVLCVESGESNSERVYDWVTQQNPKYVVLFGTSIIKDPLLSHFEGRMINMHLGLSPYYRGAGTNFWPLVEEKPECVGVTVHLAIEKVDAGAVLGQVRPHIQIGDACHDVGCKAMIAGAQLLIRCIQGYTKGLILPQLQQPGGKLFKRLNFNAQAVLRMWKNFEAGMIEEYLAHKEERDACYPIVEVI